MIYLEIFRALAHHQQKLKTSSKKNFTLWTSRPFSSRSHYELFYFTFLVFADDGLSPERSPNKSPFGVVKTYFLIWAIQFSFRVLWISREQSDRQQVTAHVSNQQCFHCKLQCTLNKESELHDREGLVLWYSFSEIITMIKIKRILTIVFIGGNWLFCCSWVSPFFVLFSDFDRGSKKGWSCWMGRKGKTDRADRRDKP